VKKAKLELLASLTASLLLQLGGELQSPVPSLPTTIAAAESLKPSLLARLVLGFSLFTRYFNLHFLLPI